MDAPSSERTSKTTPQEWGGGQAKAWTTNGAFVVQALACPSPEKQKGDPDIRAALRTKSRVRLVAGSTAAAAAAPGTAVAAAATPSATAAAAATTVSAAAAAAAEAAGTGTLFLRTSFIDGQFAAIQPGAVHRADRRLGGFGGAHGHEREAAGAARGAIDHQVDLGHGAVSGKRVLQVVLRRVERQVSNVQFGIHLNVLFGD